MKIHILGILYILSSCTHEPLHTQIAYEMMFDFSDSLKNNEGFKLDSYGGAMMNDVQKINLSYSIEKYLNISQARKLVIDISEKLISYYQAERIQPYLHDRPFSVSNIELSFSFENKNGWIYGPDLISNINVLNSTIFYNVYDPQTDRLELVYKEKYSEALIKIK
jgi:hypothetical protein